MFINITDSETGNNKASCAALVNYLEKENRLEEYKYKPECWFNGFSNNISPQEVRVKIDNNIAKLGRNDAKFFLINISPSQKEIQWLNQIGQKGSEKQLKAFAVKVMGEYAKNFKRTGIDSNTDLLWYAKLEHFRYYRHDDLEVKNGVHNKGERKDGEQMHIQVIVSRKDITNKIKLSPMNNSRGRNATHSLKLGQFDRKAFKQSGEFLFDEMFGFNRNLKDSMQYALTMKNGNSEEKRNLLTENLNIHLEPFYEIQNKQESGLHQIITQTQITSMDLFGLLLNTDSPYDEIYNTFKRKKKSAKKKRQHKR